MAHPTAATIVQHDFTSTAKITKKCVERLASFSKMRSSTDSESTQLLSKTSNKIHVLVKLIDSSIANAHLCYLFATSAVTLCEEGSKEDVTMDSLVEMSSKGAKMAKEVASGFKDVEQVVYKIAAATKDSMQIVVIPADPTHPETTKKQLKDVGTDLVANLSLFTQFSRSVDEIAEWWTCIENDLTSEAITLLPSVSAHSGSDPATTGDPLALWAGVKERLWEYYKIVDGVQLLLPDLLNSSIAAWQTSKERSQNEDPVLKTQGDSKQKKPNAFSKFFKFARHDERKKKKSKGKESAPDQPEPVKKGLVPDRNGDEVVKGNTNEVDTRKAKRSRRIPILRNCFSSKEIRD